MGINTDEFLDMTPYELKLRSDRSVFQKEQQYLELMYLAYQTAAFSRAQKLPKWETLVKEHIKKKTSVDECIKIAKEKGLKVPQKSIDSTQ